MSLKVEASTTVEITLKVSGVYRPACAAWGGARGEPPINPPESEGIEDEEITGLTASRRTWQPGQIGQAPRMVWTAFDMLEGVNVNAPDVRKLLDNLAAFFVADIEEALLGEVGDD